MPNELTRTLAAVLAGYSRAKINLAKLEQEREAKAADQNFQLQMAQAQQDFLAGENALNRVLQREQITSAQTIAETTRRETRLGAEAQREHEFDILSATQTEQRERDRQQRAFDFRQATTIQQGKEALEKIANPPLDMKVQEMEGLFGRELTEDEKKFIAFGKDFFTAESVTNAKIAESGQLTPDQIKAKDALAKRLLSEPAYKEMFEVRAGFNTATSGFGQDSGFGDIAMVNGYQRMIDPGATVREGDITTLAEAVSFMQRVFNIPGQFVEGDRFTVPVRQMLKSAIDSQYTLRVNEFNNTTRKRFERDIELNPNLSGIITYENIGDSFALPSGGVRQTGNTSSDRLRAAGIVNPPQGTGTTEQPSVNGEVQGPPSIPSMDEIRRIIRGQ